MCVSISLTGSFGSMLTFFGTCMELQTRRVRQGDQGGHQSANDDLEQTPNSAWCHFLLYANFFHWMRTEMESPDFFLPPKYAHLTADPSLRSACPAGWTPGRTVTRALRSSSNSHSLFSLGWSSFRQTDRETDRRIFSVNSWKHARKWLS